MLLRHVDQFATRDVEKPGRGPSGFCRNKISKKILRANKEYRELRVFSERERVEREEWIADLNDWKKLPKW